MTMNRPMARAVRTKATATRVVGNKEGGGKSNKSNGDGNKDGNGEGSKSYSNSNKEGDGEAGMGNGDGN
jgi:hypothetical protein